MPDPSVPDIHAGIDPSRRSRLVKTIRLGERIVNIFSPLIDLWQELSELRQIVGIGREWPYVCRTVEGSETPMFAPWNWHVLNAVVNACTDAEFSDSVAFNAKLVAVILETWDQRNALTANNTGLVSEALIWWVKEQSKPPLSSKSPRTLTPMSLPSCGGKERNSFAMQWRCQHPRLRQSHPSRLSPHAVLRPRSEGEEIRDWTTPSVSRW